MTDLLTLHKYFLTAHMTPGCAAADFTMGNGHDTVFLSKAVYGGEENPGRVWAFDIQAEALVHTEERLRSENCPENWVLLHDSHANAYRYIDRPLSVGIFNLGWLPGSADKSVTTRRTSTRPAVEHAMEMLAPDGLLLVAVYPGHEEGRLEGEMLSDMLSRYSRYRFSVGRYQFLNSPASPYFFTIEKNPNFRGADFTAKVSGSQNLA